MQAYQAVQTQCLDFGCQEREIFADQEIYQLALDTVVAATGFAIRSPPLTYKPSLPPRKVDDRSRKQASKRRELGGIASLQDMLVQVSVIYGIPYRAHCQHLQ